MRPEAAAGGLGAGVAGVPEGLGVAAGAGGVADADALAGASDASIATLAARAAPVLMRMSLCANTDMA